MTPEAPPQGVDVDGGTGGGDLVPFAPAAVVVAPGTVVLGVVTGVTVVSDGPESRLGRTSHTDSPVTTTIKTATATATTVSLRSRGGL
jgi:hypothetical protein